jgi:hypothetical protein
MKYNSLRKLSIFFISILFSFFTSLLNAEDNFKFNNIYLYSAKGVAANLREIPGAIFDLPTQETYLYAVGTFVPYDLNILKDSDHFVWGISAIVAKHSGMQSNWELDGALTLKYQELFPDNRYFNSDLAFGIGLSYAFDTPYYEEPYINDDGSPEYYKLQSFLHFDIEVYSPKLEKVHLLFRVHHRSGIYGLVAPPHVGSNFVGGGLIYYFN